MSRLRFVDRPDALEAACSELMGASRFYLDTEFESSREGTRLSLIQVSRGEDVFVIDALALRELEALGVVLAEDAEWVLHSGGQDVPLLLDAFGLEAPPRIFDVQVGWAFTSAEHSVSLAYLAYVALGKRTAKAHQADDWMRRPLPQRQLDYAAEDVKPLPALRERVLARAESLGRAEFIHDACREVVWPEREPPSPLAVESFRNAWQLEPKSQAALRFVVEWFNALTLEEREAVPDSKVLFSIASRCPENLDELGRIRGVHRRFLNHQGAPFVADLARAVDGAKASDFVPIEPAPYATFDEIRADGWLAALRAEVCHAAQMAPELALPSRVLRGFRSALLQRASDPPKLGALLEGWRRAVLAETVDRIANQLPPLTSAR
jgi:ribonuclease D